MIWRMAIIKLLKNHMETFSLLSDNYNQQFVENYQAYAKNIINTGDNSLITKKYSLFFPSCGSRDKEEIDFLIYGQATNGWKPVFNVNHLTDRLLTESIEYSNTTDQGEFYPLDWVNQKWSEYKLYTSFFWNVTYKLINLYNGKHKDGIDWRTHLIWSNLMKISPAEGGNPLGQEWTCQFEGAKKLFTREIEEIRPKFLIILTNWDWACDFLKENSECDIHKENQGEFIQANGMYKESTQIIVTKRPAVGNNEQCVAEILQLIR